MSTLPPAPYGFDPGAEFSNVTPEKNYTKCPNSAIRDDSPTRLQEGLAVMVLVEYLSHETGWKLRNAVKLAERWKEGESRFRDAIKDLERAGYLVRYKMQHPDGKWRTHTMVSADPTALAEVKTYADALAEHYAAERAAKALGQVVDNSGTNREQDSQPPAWASDGELSSQVAPDGSYRDSVDRTPVDRDSADRDSVDRVPVRRDLLEDSGEDSQEKKNPSSSSGLSSHPGAGAWPDEEEQEEQTWEEFGKAITTERPDWRLGQVRDVVTELAAAGRSSVMIRTTLALAAGDRPRAGHRGTSTPARLLHDSCPFWTTAARMVGQWAEPESSSAPSSSATSKRHPATCQCHGSGWIETDARGPHREASATVAARCPGEAAA